MTKRVPRKTNIKRSGRSTKMRPISRTRKHPVGEQIKNKISSVIVWALVVVNFVLIASLVHRLLTQYRKTPQVQIIEQSDPDIEVLNGTSVNGLAKAFADYLRLQKFDVVKVDNAESHNYRTTKVIDLKSARPRQKSQAKRVAQELGVDPSKVLTMLDEASQADVRVILGADYVNLKAYQKIR